MRPIRRLTLALAAVAALAAAAGPAAAGCKLASRIACASQASGSQLRRARAARRSAGPPIPARVTRLAMSCICTTPIGHGGGPSHRK